MNKRIFFFTIFIYISLLLSAENVQTYDNCYLVSESSYQLKNKNYTAYKYFKNKQNLLSEGFDTIHLMIASPSTQSFGSFGGHTFIVLSKGDDLTNSTAINFYGVHETLNTLQKAIMGTTKGLPAYIDIRPFSQIAERYTVGQERTIFYYKMDINKEGIVLLIDKLYELTDEKMVYQFFSSNCADFSLMLFEAALNRTFNANTPKLLVPSYLLLILERNNLVLEKGTFTPPIARLKDEPFNISKETILDKISFYNENLNETSFMDSSEKFIPQKDQHDYGTKLDCYMSQVIFGIKNKKPTLGLSFFATNRYEQRQGPTQALQINFLQMKFIYNNKINIDSFKVFEFNSYPKINYGFDFTKKFMIMGERGLNNRLQPLIRVGSGISLGNSNILFDITADVDIPLSYFGINLMLNGEVVLYNKNAYILFKGNYPFYNINFDNGFSLQSKAGVTLFDRLDINGSYNWFDQRLEASFIWNFYPFIMR